MNITVYLGSNSGNDLRFQEAAREIGTLIGMQGNTMVYGGADGGLMGICAGEVIKTGGKVIGVIPEFFTFRGHQGLHEVYVVKTMSERKQKMIELGDAFIALPGGPGTVEEISEIMSAVRIGLFHKPCIIYNAAGYYDDFRHLYDKMVDSGFLKQEERERISFADTLEDVKAALESA